MKSEIKKNFEKVFQVLLREEKIIIPKQEVSILWFEVLENWIEDETMALFVRKGSEIRGTRVEEMSERIIVRTDNTPAHWVFRNLVLEKLNFDKNKINELILSNNFPISFMRKKNEYETLIGNMVADKHTRLNDFGWKLAHIDRIAMKRGKSVTIYDYKNHHRKFLDLSNMYLIDKDYSGLAEVNLFNEVIKEYKSSL